MKIKIFDKSLYNLKIKLVVQKNKYCVTVKISLIKI